MTMSRQVPQTSSPIPDGVAANPGRERDRVLGLSGLGFFALLLAVIVVPHASLDYAVDKPPASSVITDFFSRHYALEQYQALMHSFAGVALLVFGIALAAQVARVEGPRRISSRLVAGGAVGAATVMVTTMLLVAGSITMTGGIAGRTQGWLYDIAWNEHFKMLYLVPLMLVPACLVLGRVKALPRALTWVGLLIAVLCVAAMTGVLTAGTEFLQFPVFFAVMLWVLATSVVALTRGVGVRTD